jgi:2',3'-cyclic-nucleotide 2'-phosphodiesterase (5'-nucleotidase family)
MMVRPAGLARCAAAGLLCALLAAPPAVAESVSVTFVLVSDIDKMSGRAGRGGFARLASVVAHERATRENVFFVHAGDTI